MYIRNFGDDDDEDLNNLRELSNRLSKLSGRVLPVWTLNVEDVWDLGKWEPSKPINLLDARYNLEVEYDPSAKVTSDNDPSEKHHSDDDDGR